MAGLLQEIEARWSDAGVPASSPLILAGGKAVSLDDIASAGEGAAAAIPPRSVVGHIGSFSPQDIATLLGLIDRNCIVAPLTDSTARQHEYFLETIGAEWVICDGAAEKVAASGPTPALIEQLKSEQAPGLVLFSSGTTGLPKAALHNFSSTLNKFRGYRRPSMRTLAFLMFDHIGGLNTLFHTLYNAGTIHVPANNRPSDVMRQIADEKVNLLPTTPSFLRLGLVEEAFEGLDLSELRLVTYGTERMEQITLDQLNEALPEHVDIRQTYGMSELGIFPVKNRNKKELWIRIADPKIEIEVRDGVLWVRSPHRMLGYLNAPSPFDERGFYNTRDIVEFSGDFFRIIGRADQIINVGGIKVHPSEIEDAAYTVPEVLYARARGEDDPILGQHIKLEVELEPGSATTRRAFRKSLARVLDRQRMPHRLEFKKVELTERFKKR